MIPRVRCHLADPAATLALGGRLAPGLGGGMIVTLSGDLGSGKTTLVRGMLRALGWTGPVKSPSYTLVEHYLFSSLYFYHFDFYRFADPEEWETAGFAECFRADSVCVIEWPERVDDRLPRADVAIVLAHATAAMEDEGRSAIVEADTPRGERCLAAMITRDSACAPDASPALR